MKRLLTAALALTCLVGLTVPLIGAGATAKPATSTTVCKNVRQVETKLVWNAKHTKKVRVDVYKLVKESIKQDGSVNVFYVRELVHQTIRVCTTPVLTVPTTVPVPTTQLAPVTAVAPVPRTTAPVPTTQPPPPTTTTTTTTVPVTAAPWRGGGIIDFPPYGSACVDLTTLKYTWYYDWDYAQGCPNSGVPFVPMVWGDWGNGALPSVSVPGNQYLLTFNEPDNAGQADMTVARALQLWPQLEATGLQLSSPAVTESPQGAAWLAAFMAGAAADGYRVNFIAAHWYGDCSDPASLVTYLSGLESTYGLPIWLTEFSCPYDTLAQNTTFAQAVGPMLAALPYLQRVGWFTNRTYPYPYQYTNLVDSSGALTPIGSAYVAWRA